MGCRKNSPGNPCCDTSCIDACSSVDPPATVSLTVPGFGASVWSFTTSGAFTCNYTTNPACYIAAAWTVTEEGACVTAWPSSNVNDTTYALGTTHGCVDCTDPITDDYSIWYEESQVGHRIKAWAREHWDYILSITAVGTSGDIKIELVIDFGLCLAGARTTGHRNRLKEAVVSCPDGVVTAVNGWLYADPVDDLPEPERCVDLTVFGCIDESSTVIQDGTCTDSQILAGYHRASSCTDVEVYYRRETGTYPCNASELGFGPGYCDLFPTFSGLRLRAGFSTSGCYWPFQKVWSKTIHCSELYDAPIVLDLVGGSIGGSQAVPITNAFGTYACSTGTTSADMVFSVPDTITVTFAASGGSSPFLIDFGEITSDFMEDLVS